MAKKDFSAIEQKLKSIFKVGSIFIYENREHEIVQSEKPTLSVGEPKTDLYIKTRSKNIFFEFKISIKLKNALFLQNKLTLHRAEQIFGENAQEIIKKSIDEIEENFYSMKINGYGDLYKGNENPIITLGWVFDIANRGNRSLAGKIVLSNKQKLDVFAGTTLSDEYKDAFIDKQKVKDSGIANFILNLDMNFKDIDDYGLNDWIKKIEPIHEYSKNIEMYFVCKAVNYRFIKEGIKNKPWDSNRPLAVWIDWIKDENNKIKAHFNFTNPLMTGANLPGEKLQKLLKDLDIDKSNFKDLKKYYDRFDKIHKKPIDKV
tara:strand:- start:1067 stop:2017 length:951 start_codon:yes stop_codon:yes gene_type:complete